MLQADVYLTPSTGVAGTRYEVLLLKHHVYLMTKMQP